MPTLFYVFSVLFLLGIHTIDETLACNGYTLKVNRAQNCIDNSVIKIENSGASLDKDCNLILLGCLTYPKGFKTAKGKYSLKKPPMPAMEGDLDFCEVVAGLDDPALGNVAKMYGVPTKCPIPPGKACGAPNKKINISKYKNQLGLAAGTIDVKVEAEHDTGNTCIELNISITRNKGARG